MSIELLAITPPTGPIDPDIVAAWRDAGAVCGGGLAVLLREPGAHPLQLIAERGRLGPLLRRCREERIDVVVACNFESLDPSTSKRLQHRVDGIQLRGDPDVRALSSVREWSEGMLLGRSCHGNPQPGWHVVDYTVFAPVFAPATPSPGVVKVPAGIEALTAWSTAGGWIVALGGVGPETATACIGAGARGLASIRTFFGEPARVAQDVAALVEAIGSDSHVEPKG